MLIPSRLEGTCRSSLWTQEQGEQVWGSYDFGHVKLVRGPEGRAEDSDRRTVETLSSSHCGFLLSVSRAESTFHYSGRGTSGSQRLAPVGQPGGQILRRQSGGTLDLTRRGGLFMLQASTHVHSQTPSFRDRR